MLVLTYISDKSSTHILGWGAGDVDPSLGEEGAGAQHEDNVEHRVDGVLQDMTQVLRRREVVAQTAHWVGSGGTAASDISPHSQKVDEEVPMEFHSQHLNRDQRLYQML